MMGCRYLSISHALRASRRKQLAIRGKLQHMSDMGDDRKMELVAAQRFSKELKKGNYHNIIFQGTKVTTVQAKKMEDKLIRRIQGELRLVENYIPVWNEISSRDYHNQRRQFQLKQQFASRAARMLMRGIEPPKAKIAIRIEPLLEQGNNKRLTKSQRLSLKNEAIQQRPEDIDKSHAEIIVQNMTEMLLDEFKIKVLRDSHRKWFLLLTPREEFIKMYWKQFYGLHKGTKPVSKMIEDSNTGKNDGQSD